jgi:omega-amidase
MVINPWGEIVASAGSEDGVVAAEIDLDEVTKIREEISVFKDRKEEVLYRFF